MYEQEQADLISRLYNIVLGADGWIPVNKAMMRKLGLEASMLYGELLTKYKWYFDNKKLNEHGEFYSTIEEIQADTSLDKRNQKKAIDILVKEGLIEVHNRVPSGGQSLTRHFKVLLNPANLDALIYPTKKVTDTEEIQEPKSSQETTSQESKSFEEQDLYTIVEYFKNRYEYIYNKDYNPTESEIKKLRNIINNYSTEQWGEMIPIFIERYNERWKSSKYPEPTIFGLTQDWILKGLKAMCG